MAGRIATHRNHTVTAARPDRNPLAAAITLLPAMLRIRVLGELELELDGERIEPPRRGPARNLLAWLALHPGRHPRSAVAGRLWPNVLDTSARASLRTSLSALRTTIGSAALISGRTHVGLADGKVWVDAHEFDRLRAAGRAEDALLLRRGELLTGLDEDWVLIARDEHRDAQGGLLAALAEDAAERGEPETAVALARRRAALDPLDEAAHRDLMVRLVQAGDRAGALSCNERFAERLRRQLGVAPSPTTRQLVSALRAGSLADGYRPTTKPRGEQPPLPTRRADVRRWPAARRSWRGCAAPGNARCATARCLCWSPASPASVRPASSPNSPPGFQRRSFCTGAQRRTR
jgi:DNA-binding SARP family transcriptional activator